MKEHPRLKLTFILKFCFLWRVRALLPVTAARGDITYEISELGETSEKKPDDLKTFVKLVLTPPPPT